MQYAAPGSLYSSLFIVHCILGIYTIYYHEHLDFMSKMSNSDVYNYAVIT